MADLTATSWSITATGTVIHSKERTTQVVMTIASGNAGVYPLSGGVGIPLPTNPGSYGMVRNLDYIIIHDQMQNVATLGGLKAEYIASGPGIRLYTMAATSFTAGAALAEMASGVAPANTNGIVIKGTAHGW